MAQARRRSEGLEPRNMASKVLEPFSEAVVVAIALRHRLTRRDAAGGDDAGLPDLRAEVLPDRLDIFGAK